MDRDGWRLAGHVAGPRIVAGDKIELGRLRKLQLPEIKPEG
jgi:hypothetical protein